VQIIHKYFPFVQLCGYSLTVLRRTLLLFLGLEGC